MPQAKYNKAALYCGTALAMLTPPAAAQPAPNARPSGGQMAAGQASIGGNSTLTLINQHSQNAVINWQSYNVGSAQTVQYQQPNAQSFALNRVISAQPSQIAGHIIANGQIAIVNQSGVVFYHGATVDTAGLVVSASGITNQDFMAGRLVFLQAPNPGAKISNAGNITIAQAGLAAIVAPQVQNSGTISAQLGRVVLGGAATFALDMNGDGLVALNVTGEVTRVQIGNQSVPALVTNIGTILAPGGTVVLTAAAADGLVQKIISAGGTIATPTVGGSTGRVLVSGIGGDVEIDGTVSATGTAAGTKGGQIEVNSDHNVTIASVATLDTSGDSGGGLIAVGTTAAYAASAPSGQATLTAANTTIAAGATLRANATRIGNGGRIAVAASGTATISGAVAARGGSSTGNGGNVMITGRNMVVSTAPDTSAQAGAHGEFIALVNGDTTICDSGCTDTYTKFFSLASEGATFTVNNGFLEFEPSQSNASTTGLAIDFTTVDGGGQRGIAGNIFVDQDTSLVATGVTGSAAGTFFILGTLSAGAAGAMSLTGGVSLTNAQGPVITEDNSDPGAPPQPPAVIADTLALKAENGDVQLEYASNQIGTLVATTSSGTINIGNGAALTVSGPLSATNVTLTTYAGDITDLGSISATAANGLIDLTAAGGINLGGTLTAGTLSGGVYGGLISLDAQAGAVTESANDVFGQLNAGTLSAQATGDVDLQGASGAAPVNQISILSSGSAGGDFILSDASNLDVTGGILAGTAGVAGDNLLLLEVGTATASSSLTISPDITLTDLGGTIGLQADHLSIDGALDASSGEVAYDIYKQNGTLALGGGTFNGVTYVDSFDQNGIGAVDAGTLVLGRIPGQTGRAGTVFFGIGLAGPIVGLYSTGTILEDTNQGFGALSVDVLFGTAGGAITLNTTSNDIGAVVNLTSGGALVLDDAGPLTIAGNLSGTSVYLNVADQVVEDEGATVAATNANGTLAIESGKGGISLFGSNDAGTLNANTNTYSGTVLLSAIGGDISETQAEGGTTGTIGAGTLAASATGSISLTDTADNVATIAPGTLPDGTKLAGLVAGDTLAFTDDQSLALANALVGGSAVTLDATGTISQSGGSVTASSGAVSLTAASITLGGVVQAGGQSVVLDATNGNLSETSGGAIITGTLTASALSGTVDLGSVAEAAPVNQVGTLAAGTAAGNFIFTDATDLTVTGTVMAGGSSLLLESGTSTAASTLVLTSGATLIDGGGAIALTADNFSLAGGTLNAGTGEADFANFLPGGTLTYGGAGSSFSGTSLGDLTADKVALTSTGDIVIADTLSLGSDTLGLFAGNGSILEQGTSAGITAGLLAGVARGNITLNGANAITTIGTVASIAGTSASGLSSTGGALSLTDGNSDPLVIGPGATLASLQALTIIDAAGLTQDAASLIDSGDASVSLSLSGAALSQTNAALTAATDVIIDGSIGQTTSTILATSGNATITGGLTQDDAALTAGGSVTVTGATLTQTASSITGTAGVFLTVTGGIAQDDASAITSAGGTILLESGTFGDMTLDGTVTSGTLANGSYTGTLALVTDNGDAQGFGAIHTGTLAGSIDGALTLSSGGNNIAAIGAVTIDGQALDGLRAGINITLQDSVALAIGSTAHAATVAAQLGFIDITTLGTLVETNAAIRAGSDITLQSAGTTQTNASILTSSFVALDGSLTQSASSLTAGLGVQITGGTVTQSGASSIVGAGGVDLLLTGGLSQQDAASVITTGATLLVNTTGGDIDFAGTLQGGTIALLTGNGSINGSGTVLATTLAASATGSLLLDGTANVIDNVAPVTLTANGVTLTGLSAGDALNLRDTASLAVTNAQVTGNSVTLSLVDANGTPSGTLTETASAITTTGSATITAGALAQADAASITGTRGIYVILADGLTQDSSSTITAGGGPVPPQTLLIDSSGGDIDFAGVLRAGTIALSAGGSIQGTLVNGQPTTSGTILAGTLAADAGGQISLGNAANSVGAIDALTITNQAIPGTLALAGLTAGGNLLLNDTTSLAIGTAQAGATVQGTAVTMTLVNGGNTVGTISQTGGTIAATTGDILLQSLAVTQTNGAIASDLGDITVTGDLTQTASQLTAAVNAAIGGNLGQTASSLAATGGSVTVGEDATQSNGSTLTASGGDVAIGGNLTQSSSLLAASNNVSIGGTLAQTAGTLTAGDAVTIASDTSQTNNSTLTANDGSVGVGGNLSQVDSLLSASVDVTVTDTITQFQSTLGAGGNVTAGGTLSQTAGTLIAGNSVAIAQDASQSAGSTLSTSTGSVSIGGSLTQANSQIAAAGAVSIGAGATQATSRLVSGDDVSVGGTLVQTASALTAADNVSITGTTTQTTSTLSATSGTVGIGGDLTQTASALTAGTNVAVVGAVSQTNSTLTALGNPSQGDGNVAIGGALTQAASLLTAQNNVTVGQDANQSAASTLTAGGSATITGNLIQANSLLTTGGTLTIGLAASQSGGTIESGAVTVGAGLSQVASLLTATDDVSIFGGLSQSDSTLLSGREVIISGPGALSQSNFSTLNGLYGVFATTNDGIAQTGESLIASADGPIELIATDGDIIANGILQSGDGRQGLVGYGGNIDLVATNGSIDDDGTLITNVLAASAAGSLIIGGDANQIASIAPQTLTQNGISLAGITAGGALTLIDSTALLLNGATLNGTLVNLDDTNSAVTQDSGQIVARTGGITMNIGAFDQVAGSIQSAGTLQLAAAGNITQTGAASMFATGAVALTLQGGDFIQNAGGIIASYATANGKPTDSGAITIDTSGNVSLSGTLAAGNIQIGSKTAPKLVSWHDNTIMTGSSLPTKGLGLNLKAPINPSTQQGVFIDAYGLNQTGFTTVDPLGAPQSTVQITLAGAGGLVSFDPGQGTGSGLYAPRSQLVLNLKTNGRASGNIDVAGLNVFYTGPHPPTTGAADLTGIVDGESGFSAAAAGFTHSVPGTNYRINDCPIQSINCILLSPIVVPVINPVEDVQQTVLRRRDDDDDDLILPNVGEQDY